MRALGYEIVLRRTLVGMGVCLHRYPTFERICTAADLPASATAGMKSFEQPDERIHE